MTGKVWWPRASPSPDTSCGAQIRVAEPGGRVAEPGGRVAEPGGRVAEPGGRVAESGVRSFKTKSELKL